MKRMLGMMIIGCSHAHAALALSPCGALPDRIFDNSFGIGPSISVDAIETTLDTSSVSGLQFLPDEHSSFIAPVNAGDPYLFFEAGRVSAGAGAIVLATDTNMQTFAAAVGYDAPVLYPPLPFGQCAPADNLDLDNEFDENYAAPGSVLQDPTRPQGNLIMVYEAENHCRSHMNVPAYYASVGFARSSDNGVTWSAPSNTQPPDPNRYQIVAGPDLKPDYDTTLPLNEQPAIGDAIPSAYVEGSCMYVVDAHHPAPGQPGHYAAIQIARADLSATEPLTFEKFLNNGATRGFDSNGLAGSATDIIQYLPAGTTSPTPICTGQQYHAQLGFNNRLHRYLMTFVCGVSGATDQLAWFFSTATSLELEDWTPPQIISGSQSTSSTGCNTANDSGVAFDGWYPSFYSVGLASGHTGASGIAFYMDGCNTGNRSFMSRGFTVTADPG